MVVGYGLLFMPPAQEFLVVNSCLDLGGSYDYDKEVCDKQVNHPASPKYPGAIQHGNLVAAGLTMIFGLILVVKSLKIRSLKWVGG